MASAVQAHVEGMPDLASALRGLLTVLGRGARTGSEIRVDVAAGNLTGVPGCPMPKSTSLAAVPRRFVPHALCELLDWREPLRLRLAARDSGGLARTLSAVAVTFDVPRGPRYRIDAAQVVARWARAERFLPVTAVIQAASQLSAVWALELPLEVETPAGEAAALSLVRAMARTLGGIDPGQRVADVYVPCPGSRPGSQMPGRVECLAIDLSRSYRLPEIQAALAAAKE